MDTIFNTNGLLIIWENKNTNETASYTFTGAD